jgi:flagellar hook-associated protein 3 FlgL
MRVTQSTLAITAQEGMARSLASLAVAQEQLASGKRISRFSDAPVDTTSVLRMRAQQDDYSAYTGAGEDGLAWLNTQDQALQSASELLGRARELAIQAAADIRTPVERNAIAAELTSIRDQLATLANSTYLGRSVFGGFQTPAVTQVGTTWTWTGDPAGTAQVLRRVGPDTVIQVNLDGEDVFGFAAGTDVFAVLDTLAADTAVGNTAAVTAGITALDGRADAVRAGLGLVGTKANQVQGMLDAGALQVMTLRTNRAGLEDADMADAALRLAQAQTAYQASLAATAQLSLTSLVDFLR